MIFFLKKENIGLRKPSLKPTSCSMATFILLMAFAISFYFLERLVFDPPRDMNAFYFFNWIIINGLFEMVYIISKIPNHNLKIFKYADIAPLVFDLIPIFLSLNFFHRYTLIFNYSGYPSRNSISLSNIYNIQISVKYVYCWGNNKWFSSA